MGTLAYMAPEFLRNKKLTTRTDVYAFGVVMLELYTGQPAFSADIAHKDRLLVSQPAHPVMTFHLFPLLLADG